MAITTLPIFGYPAWPYTILASVSGTIFVIDASGEKVASVIQSPIAGDVSKIHYRTGTLAQSYNLRVSLQNVSATDGYPDGTEDQYVDVATDSATDSNVWKTVTLGSNRTVAVGDVFAVVFAITDFATSDIFRLTSTTNTVAQGNYGVIAGYAKTASGIPVMIVEMADGSFMPLMQGHSYFVNTTLASTSNPVRQGVKFNLPFSCRVRGLCTGATITNGSGAKLVYYGTDGINLVSTALPNPYDYDLTSTTSGDWTEFWFSSAITLSANTNYYFYLENTTTTAVNHYYWQFPNAASRACSPFGTNFTWVTQHSTNSPTEDTTRIPAFYLLLDGMDFGGSAAGMIVHPGMSGGMRG